MKMILNVVSLLIIFNLLYVIDNSISVFAESYYIDPYKYSSEGSSYMGVLEDVDPPLVPASSYPVYPIPSDGKHYYLRPATASVKTERLFILQAPAAIQSITIGKNMTTNIFSNFNPATTPLVAEKNYTEYATDFDLTIVNNNMIRVSPISKLSDRINMIDATLGTKTLHARVKLVSGQTFILSLRNASYWGDSKIETNNLKYPIEATESRRFVIPVLSSLSSHIGNSTSMNLFNVSDGIYTITPEKARAVGVGRYIYKARVHDNYNLGTYTGSYANRPAEFVTYPEYYAVAEIAKALEVAEVTLDDSNSPVIATDKIESASFVSGKEEETSFTLDNNKMYHNDITESIVYDLKIKGFYEKVRVKFNPNPEPLEAADIDEAEYEKGSQEDIDVLYSRTISYISVTEGPTSSISYTRKGDNDNIMSFSYQTLDELPVGTYNIRVKFSGSRKAYFTLTVTDCGEQIYPTPQEYIKHSERAINYFFGVEYFNITNIIQTSGTTLPANSWVISNNEVNFDTSKLDTMQVGTYTFKATITTGITRNFTLVIKEANADTSLILDPPSAVYVEGETGLLKSKGNKKITQFTLPSYPTLPTGAVALNTSGELVIIKNLLVSVSPGDIPIEVKSADDSKAVFNLAVVREERRDKHWNQNIREFNKNTSARAHKDFEMSSNSTSLTIQSVKIDGVTVPNNKYTVTGGVVIIGKDYLKTKAVNERARVTVDYDGSYSVDFYLKIVDEANSNNSATQIDC